MKLLVTVFVLIIMALCYWAMSDDSIYWRTTRGRNGKLEDCILSICLFFGILFMIFVWLN